MTVRAPFTVVVTPDFEIETEVAAEVPRLRAAAESTVSAPEEVDQVEAAPAVIVKAPAPLIALSQPVPMLMAFSVPELPVIVPMLMPLSVPAPTPVALMFTPFSVPPVVIVPVLTYKPLEVIEPPADWVMFGRVTEAPRQSIEPAVPLVTAPAVPRLRP